MEKKILTPQYCQEQSTYSVTKKKKEEIEVKKNTNSPMLSTVTTAIGW